MKKSLILMVLAVVLMIPSAHAGVRIYTYHEDFGNDPTIPDWLEGDIHATHDIEMCTNYTPEGQTAKKRCSNYTSNSPRANDTGCGNQGGMYLSDGCWAVATVLCPGIGVNDGWVTFVCTQDEPVDIVTPVAAGIIDHDGTKPIKGVRCGATECGCRVDSGTSSSPWGSGDWTTDPDIVHCN